MATAAQLAANRRNSQLSTGPKTPEGKAAVSQNAVKHGLTGRHILLADENPDAFDLLEAGLTADHRPKTTTEEILVRRMAEAEWRIRRIVRRETAVLAEDPSHEQSELILLNRYEAVHTRTLFRSLNHLDRYKANPMSAPYPNAQTAATAMLRDLSSALKDALLDAPPAENETNPIPLAVPSNPQTTTATPTEPRPHGCARLEPCTTPVNETNPISDNPNTANDLESLLSTLLAPAPPSAVHDPGPATPTKSVNLATSHLLQVAQQLRAEHAAGGNPNVVAGMDSLLAALAAPAARAVSETKPISPNAALNAHSPSKERS